MGTKKSSRRQMATLLCWLGAIVVGGVAADAWAQIRIRHDLESCWVCLNFDPQTQVECRIDEADYVYECNDDERARCSINEHGQPEGRCECRPSLDPDCVNPL